MKNCSFRVLSIDGKDLFIYLHNDIAPEDDVWASSLAAMVDCERRNSGSIASMRVMAITDGGAPEAHQRRDFTTFLNGRSLPVSVVTEHMVARGVVTAISWFNPLIKAFAPKAASNALKHLELKPIDMKTVLNEIAGFSSQVGQIRALEAMLAQLQSPTTQSV